MNTECVCGYAYRRKVLEEDDLGDEEFIQVEGSFTITREYESTRKVRLYACPKCDTVQMNRW